MLSTDRRSLKHNELAMVLGPFLSSTRCTNDANWIDRRGSVGVRNDSASASRAEFTDGQLSDGHHCDARDIESVGHVTIPAANLFIMTNVNIISGVGEVRAYEIQIIRVSGP